MKPLKNNLILFNNFIDMMIRCLPSYQLQGQYAYKPGLKRVLFLSRFLGSPHLYFKSIHVAGTNGKGSTSHMLSSVLQENGYNVGLFTSPHLLDMRERIKYNGNYIDKDFIDFFLKKIKDIIFTKQFSFFEIFTVLSFVYFKHKRVDFAIIETGLGGLLDATNILKPLISVITSINYDHMEILGETLYEIAIQKAGIIKYKTPVVISPGILNNKIKQLFYDIAIIKKSNIFFCEKKNNYKNIKLSLYGFFQVYNMITVLKCVSILKKYNFLINDKKINLGFNNIIKNTNFLGRWHIISYKPKIICDIAHNEESMLSISSLISEEVYNNIFFIIGFVYGKNILKILSCLPKKGNFYFCSPGIFRGLNINILKKITINDFDNNGEKLYFKTVEKAFLRARCKSSINDLILITGSSFIVSDFLKIYKNL